MISARRYVTSTRRPKSRPAGETSRAATYIEPSSTAVTVSTAGKWRSLDQTETLVENFGCSVIYIVCDRADALV